MADETKESHAVQDLAGALNQQYKLMRGVVIRAITILTIILVVLSGLLALVFSQNRNQVALLDKDTKINTEIARYEQCVLETRSGWFLAVGDLLLGFSDPNIEEVSDLPEAVEQLRVENERLRSIVLEDEEVCELPPVIKE